MESEPLPLLKLPMRTKIMNSDDGESDDHGAKYEYNKDDDDDDDSCSNDDSGDDKDDDDEYTDDYVDYGCGVDFDDDDDGGGGD